MRRGPSLLGLATLSALALAACGDSPTRPEARVVRSGTSFGFCLPTSYCQTTLQLTRGSAVHVRTSQALGEVGSASTLSEAEWQRVVDAVDERALRSLPDNIGCPGCRDEGAEWVEVATASWTKRVTFSYNESVPSIQPLLDEVRRIRSRFEPAR